MNRSLIAFSIFALVGAVGCGGTDMGGDDFGTTSGPDLAGTHLMSGSYNVSNIVKVSDGCGLIFEGDTTANPPIDPLATLQVTNTGTMLSLGTKYDNTTDPMWSPAGYAGGSGAYTDATHATLTATATVTLADGCTYTTTRTTTATFTGNNMLSVDFTDMEKDFSQTCITNQDTATAPCTSEYTFDLAM